DQVDFLNTTVANNRASYKGGGIYNYASQATLESVTLAGNWGGGLFSTTDPGNASTTLKNTIVAGNHTAGPTSTENDVAGPIQSAASNLIQSTTGATISPLPSVPPPGVGINIGLHAVHD